MNTLIASLEERELVLCLLKDLVSTSQLVRTLRDHQVALDDYELELPKTIFKVMGIQSTVLFDVFLVFEKQLRESTIAPINVQEVAGSLFVVLVSMREGKYP